MTYYDEDTNLPTGEANSIVQTEDGYIWIASYGGLIRYDGSNFVNFKDEIKTSSVRALFEDSEERLFIGTNEDGVFIYEGGEFIQVICNGASGYKSIRGFAENDKGDVYAATSAGLTIVSGNELVPISKNSEDAQLVDITSDKFGSIWTLDSTGHICIYNGEMLADHLTTEELFSKGYAYAMTRSRDGNIYLGSTENEVSKLIFEEDYRNKDIIDAISYRTYSTGEISNINCLKENRDGRLLVGGNTGFGFFNREHFEIVGKSKAGNYAANWCECDDEGNFWVATSNLGVLKYSKSYFTSYNDNSGLEGITINAVHKHGNLFYVATDAGIQIFDSSWKEVRQDWQKMTDGVRVRNICEDIYGNIYFATYSIDYGVIRLNPDTMEIKTFCKNEGVQNEKIRVVYPLSDGRVLVGNQLGVAIIDGDVITEKYGSEDGLEISSILCALETDGRIFVGSDGAGVYEIKNGKLISYGEDKGLRDGVVLRMVADSDSPENFFVCANDSIYYFDNENFTLLEGFEKSAGSVYNLYDIKGKLWILQNNGILSVDKTDFVAGKTCYTEIYSFACGLPGSLSANTWNYLDKNTGRLYFASRNGVGSFEFKDKNVSLPRGVINSITLDSGTINHPEKIVIPEDNSRMTIDFSAILFSDAKQFIMRYQLMGFDEEPMFSTNKHEVVSYTNLPGGEYSFVLEVLDPQTASARMSRTADIEKEVAVKETTWFRVLMFVLVILITAAIAFGIYKLRMIRMKKRQKELMDITEQALLSIANTIDAKDKYTKGHSVRVATYAREIAKRMGYSEEEQLRVYYIGLLHDIGKIGVPDSILNKPGKLTDEERAIIQHHVVTGGEILKDFTSVKGISEGAKYHHERYDGKGYVEHLSGKDIPEIARIIGIADSYDAMQSARVYKPGFTDEFIMEEIKNCAGTQFDPDIVPYMVEMMEEKVVPIDL